MITVLVNNEEYAVSATTLADLLDELGYGGARVATALDGVFIPAPGRAAASLGAGARVEVVAPMQGG